MKGAKTVTLKTIASRAGCSSSVVAKVLNKTAGNTRVSEELSDRIKKIAADAGYIRNQNARRLRRGSADTVGFVNWATKGGQDPISSELANGVSDGAKELDRDVLLIGVDDQRDLLPRVKRYAQERRFDALVAPLSVFQHALAELAKTPVPVVLVVAAEPVPFPVVGQDLNPGFRGAAEYLADLGHRKVLWAGLKSGGKPSVVKRYRCFSEHAKSFGIDVEEFYFVREAMGDSSDLHCFSEGAYRQFNQYLADHDGPGPSAIMAYNDLVAIGIIHALREQGYRVPEDVEVIGYDNFYAEAAVPRLTTIDMNMREIGRQGVKLAFEIVDNPGLYEKWKRTVIPVPNRFVGHRE